MIPGVDVLTLVSFVGVFGVAAIIFAESGLLVGFFLPGDSVLFASGLLINSGILHVNIVFAIILFFVAAVTGDSVGYWFGKKAGPRIFARPDARLFKREYIERAQEFYEKHGGKSIILARFIPVVRTFAPIVAGAGQMPYRRFLSFNVVGGFVWTVGITLLGFFLGRAFEMAGIEIDTVIYPLIAVVVFVSILPPAIHLLANKKRRASFFAVVRRQATSLFSRSK